MSRDRAYKRIELTPRDVRLFQVLNRYRYLRSTFVQAFVGGNPVALRWRLRDLFDGGYLARPEQQWQSVNARYMPTIYELDQKGVAVLKDCGLDSSFARVTVRPGRDAPHHQFPHDLMVCDILASIELGVILDPALQFITVHEILERAPENTKLLRKPLAMALANTEVVPDALFGVRYPEGVRFFALEADRNNEPIRRRLSGSSYERKIAAYKQIVDQKIYKSHFGIPNLLVLNVTTNPTHMNNIMALVKQMVGQSRFFLFKTMSSLGDFAKAPSPTPHMLTAAWQRVGHEPFAMNK